MDQFQMNVYSNEAFVDFRTYQVGREQCQPQHLFGPAKRNHYLFHYVLSGKGTLMATDHDGITHTFQIHAGEGFMIFPGQINMYMADADDPWDYVWVEFDGLRATELLARTPLRWHDPVFRTGEMKRSSEMKQEMLYLVEHPKLAPLSQTGHLYLFLDALIDCLLQSETFSAFMSKDRYINEAINFIEENYMNDISVESIAKRAGLDRSYFGKLFKKATDMSPQHFLLNYRMTKAAELLRMTNLPVSEIGRQVGYSDQLHFSRAFKSIYGLSPRNWRKEIMEL